MSLAVLLAVLAAELARRVESERLDLVAFLLLATAMLALALMVSEVGLGLTAIASSTRTGIRVAIVTSCMALVGLELGLRFVGTYATYLERNGERSYSLRYHHTSPSRYLVFSPHTSYTHPRQEFAFPRTTNSLGLADREIPAAKDPVEYRIIALGDSYTEGVGTDYTDTWIQVACRRLAAANPDRTIAAFNAGISGSDPWYAYVLFSDKLLGYRPDMVIVAINASDVNDTIIRGGRERFLADGTVRRQPTPWWEWIYGVSYLARHVTHDVLRYNTLFVRESQWPQERRRAGESLVEAVNAFAALGRDHGIRVVVVVHPDRLEATRQRYERSFAQTVADIKRVSDVEVVDVLERWRASGVLDGDAVTTLYWTIDGHNTPKGYRAFGETVADRIAEIDRRPVAH